MPETYPITFSEKASFLTETLQYGKLHIYTMNVSHFIVSFICLQIITKM